MILKFLKRKLDVKGLFMGHYVDPKAFYVMLFNELPCVSYIGELDTSKAFEYITNGYKSQLKDVYQHNYFDHDKQQFFFNNNLFVLNEKRMIELGNNFCHVLHTKDQYAFGSKMIKELATFRITAGAASENRIIGFSYSNQINEQTN
jgi:hypothetical protein